MINRYKRFFADVQLSSGEIITAHTPNTGSMESCWRPGWSVMVSYHDDPLRKLKYTLQMIDNGVSWIGVNTHLPNNIVAAAIEAGKIPEFLGHTALKKEVKIGASRLDLQVDFGDRLCFIEIKNVTLKGEKNAQGLSPALFPDAVTTRGLKHIHELRQLVKQGHRTVMFFLIQRQDIDFFSPAKEIDPEYAAALAFAIADGVEVLPYVCQISPEQIQLSHKIDLVW